MMSSAPFLKSSRASEIFRVRPKVGLDRFQRMISSGMKEVADLKRYSSPTVTPQALAWDGKQLWMSSRDLGTLYRTELDGLKIVEEIDPPGVVWAGVATNDGWRFTIGRLLDGLKPSSPMCGKKFIPGKQELTPGDPAWYAIADRYCTTVSVRSFPSPPS